jgi:pyruvate dehydrogenase E2 component (dihydrolipoamide acetyltransferase)
VPIEVVMPRLGWDMQVGRLAEWLKHDGDQVAVGDAICTIEGDKATSELESLDSGVLRIPPGSPPPGEEVPVGTVLAYLVGPGEEIPFATATQSLTPPGRAPSPPSDLAALTATSTPSAPGGPPIVATPTASDASAGPPLGATADDVTVAPEQRQMPGSGATPPAGAPQYPRTREQERQAERGRDAAAAGSAPIGSRRQQAFERGGVQSAATAGAEAIGPGRAQAPRARERRQVASPRARRAAADLGVDVRSVIGSGRSGRVLERDIRAAVASAATSGRAAPAAAREAEAAQPLSQIRRITAARMAESAHTAAPVTLTTEADATRLVELRAQIRADSDALGIVVPPLSYNELLVKLLAVALAEQPALNASWLDGRVVQHSDVHIGVAVDTERGLLVPVVRDVRTKSLATISRELQSLIAAAQDGALGVDQLKGGTFTLTNLGMYDIDAFTPIVNLPECAILGVGRIVPRPIVVDARAETVQVRRMLALSLTFDHRVVDGGPAARFLQRVKQLVEHPGAWVTR